MNTAEALALNELNRLGLDLRELKQVPNGHTLQTGRIIELFDGKGKVGFYRYWSDGVPFLSVGNWRTGEKFKGSLKANPSVESGQVNQNSTGKEKAKSDNVEAIAIMHKLWAEAEPTSDNITSGYLTIKAVKPRGLKIARIIGNKNLLIDYRNIDGELLAITKIYKQGDTYAKQWQKGSQKTGAFKALNHCDKPSTIYIGEGYATVASFYEYMLFSYPNNANNSQFISVGDCSNIEPVTSLFRSKHATANITIITDNDGKDGTQGIGELKAIEALKKHGGGTYIMPTIEGLDFNDLAVSHGDKLTTAISSILKWHKVEP
jgi:phage/plasmid primase-like uncharacterized protein